MGRSFRHLALMFYGIWGRHTPQPGSRPRCATAWHEWRRPSGIHWAGVRHFRTDEDVPRTDGSHGSASTTRLLHPSPGHWLHCGEQHRQLDATRLLARAGLREFLASLSPAGSWRPHGSGCSWVGWQAPGVRPRPNCRLRLHTGPPGWTSPVHAWRDFQATLHAQAIGLLPSSHCGGVCTDPQRTLSVYPKLTGSKHD